MKDLKGKVVLVTGGGHGIGRETALAFAREGARVVVADVNQAWLDETVEMLEREGCRATGVQVDLREREQVESMVDRAVSEAGPVDVLVNNAGIVYTKRFVDLSGSEIQDTLDVDLMAPIWACRRVAPSMLERGSGHIVNVSSAVGKTSNPFLSVYCASKFGLVGFTDTLQQELGPRGVGTTVVNPGWISSGMFSGAKRIALITRWSPPEYVAGIIVSAVKKNRAEVHVPRIMWIGGFLRALLGPKVMAVLWRLFGGDSLFASVKGHE